MSFFELLEVMRQKKPIIAKIKAPSYETVIEGTICEVCYRLDKDGKERLSVGVSGKTDHSTIFVEPKCIVVK